jgi:amidophosphoribosyltransferase
VADLPAAEGGGREIMIASETVALEGTGHTTVRDVAPGEALFIDMAGQVHAQQCADAPQLHPCMFEYVYLARPDSVMDGISVYQARLNLGETLAQRVINTMPPSDIDVVIPIPESSRPSAMQLAQKIGKPYREGFVKNRYVGRTFIMPGQAGAQEERAPEAQCHRRGVQGPQRAAGGRQHRARHHQQGDRADGPRGRRTQGLHGQSAAPPVRYPNVYGIDMPTSEELIAHGRTIEEIRQFIGADALIYQDVDAMKRVVGALNPAIAGFEASCFDGEYITGDVSVADFAAIEAQRTAARQDDEDSHARTRLTLQSRAEAP